MPNTETVLDRAAKALADHTAAAAEFQREAIELFDRSDARHSGNEYQIVQATRATAAAAIAANELALAAQVRTEVERLLEGLG